MRPYRCAVPPFGTATAALKLYAPDEPAQSVDHGIPPSANDPFPAPQRPRPPIASSKPSGAADWLPILSRLGVAANDIDAIEARARLNGVSFQRELATAGIVAEERLAEELASQLGLAFLATPYPASLTMSEAACRLALRLRDGPPFVQCIAPGESHAKYLITATNLNLPALAGMLRARPSMAARLVVVPPSALREAIVARAMPELTRLARDGLAEGAPSFSARIVATAAQGVFIGALLVALPVCLALAPSMTLMAAHAMATLFFLSCVVLRLAVSGGGPTPLKLPRLAALDPTEMPVYTVLVALYREADIVPDLMHALGKIVWPRSKLEIKLVCEADDEETLAAIRARPLRSWVEVVEVPACEPRTKPKALSYALPMSSGDFVVLYDAEDRPHPFQLAEAWHRFRDAGPDLACLQAPLSITNRSEGWLAGLFGLEYAALFRGVLPWLARRHALIPLGGTSNHFRREALDRVGGWDPYNVTEDADLGMRLKRFGYRIATLQYPTQEEAPEAVGVWMPQRTRWFKGWAQTWLVHMREPGTLSREIGTGNFLLAQILFAGMLLSALVHPFFLASAFWFGADLVLGDAAGSRGQVLLAVDTLNIVGGYLAFLALGWQTLARDERRGFTAMVLVTPFYWTLLSLAAWRALWQLYRKPHYWAKTPHTPRRRAAVRTP